MAQRVIEAYVEYLRNISRKIISRSGFLNVLPEETRKKFNLYKDISENSKILNEDPYVITKEDEFFKYARLANNYLDDNKDIKLFIGSGLINGYLKGRNKGNNICAPLFYGILDLEFDEDSRNYMLSIDYESCQLNHDLISRIFDLDIEEEFEEESILPDTILVKYNNVDVIENKYFEKDIFRDIFNKVLSNSEDIFLELYNNLPDFKKIQIEHTSKFNYKERLLKGNSSDKVIYYPHTFLFVNNVPHQLSTYEALNNLLHQKPIDNKLLKKLFQNILTDEKTSLNFETDVSNENVVEVLNNYIPLTLSENQNIAITKAWTSELSYIQGPPGTGKSFTITAIILTALFLNKKVLLVSHKDAAIKVVKKMVDDILGDESILYIGSHDRTKTKEYLSSIITKADSYSSDLFNAGNNFDLLEKQLKTHKSKLVKNITKYKETYEKLSYLLKIENEFYKAHKEFLEKRTRFNEEYNIENMKEIKWSIAKFNEDKYSIAIKRFHNITQKTKLNRVDILYKYKFVKHFIKKFKCNKDIIFNDPIYAESIFQLNFNFSLLNNILNKIDNKVVNQLRKNLSSTIKELQILQKEYLPLYYNISLMSKLIGKENRNNRENISSLRKMLHFKRADLLKNKIESIDFNTVLDILPLWCSELRDLGKVLPMQNEIFDLIIIDEASQVNIAEIIPAFYRGKRYCVVGDKNQLNLNATGVGFAVSKSFEKISWQHTMSKYAGVISYDKAKNMNLLVSESSILDFVSSDTNNFNIPTVSLDEHFRSLPPLASFTNKVFYDDKWKIMTQNGENMKKICFKRIKVNGERDKTKKLIRAEINKVIDILKLIRENEVLPELEPFLQYKNGETFTFGILAFLTQQVIELRQIIETDFEDLVRKHQIFIATPEEFQGNERDVMFITLGLDTVSRWGKSFYENENRFNVATSRAKYFTYFIYSGIPKNVDLIKKYLRHYGVEITPNDELEMIEKDIEPQYEKWKFEFDKIESDFELEVYKYLSKYKDTHNEIEIYNQVNACGQKRLDFVLYNKDKKVTAAIEVDGKDHFINGTYNYTEAHLNRVNILKRAGWNIINVKYYNWWDNGWISNEENPYFKEEINRLYSEFDKLLFN